MAEMCRRSRQIDANKSANGIVNETIKRGASVSQKNEEHDHDKDHSLAEIVQHRVRRVVDQVVAVQIRNDFHSWRQYLVVELFDRGVNSVHRRGRVCAFAHEHDAFHHVVIVNHDTVATMYRSSNLPQADPGPLGDDGNVFDAYRSALLRFQHNLFNVLDISHQSDRANVDLLCAFFDKAAAGVGVAVGQLLFNLSETQAVGDQFVGIHANLIFASQTAE